MNNENYSQRLLLARLDMLVADYQQASSRIADLNRQQTELINYQTSIRQSINSTLLNDQFNTSTTPIFTRPSTLDQDNLPSLNRSFNFSQIFADFLEPILIYPTDQEIDNSTTTLLFSEIENPLNTTCPIRSEEFVSTDQVLKINYCGHIFSKNELLQWFRRNHRCPICRYDIRNNSNSNI